MDGGVMKKTDQNAGGAMIGKKNQGHSRRLRSTRADTGAAINKTCLRRMEERGGKKCAGTCDEGRTKIKIYIK